MNSTQIMQALKGVTEFGGIFASDELPNYIPNKPVYIIVNTDPASKPGKHWLALYIDGICNELYDSLGKDASSYNKHIEYFMIIQSPKYKYNSQRLQNFGSDVCGNYCIQYIILREMGYSINEIVRDFSENLVNNDEIVTEFYNKLGE